MAERQAGTPGGARLRALREAQHRTQLWVELEAELGTGYLQRLESGRVGQPERPTLERILDALGARFSERREVLELFGYTVRPEPPTREDADWARSISRAELEAFPFPAYVLDCTPRLIAWNDAFPELLGLAVSGPLPAWLTQGSFLAAWFDPHSPLHALVVEPDVLLPALIRTFRHEMQAYRREGWYASLLAELMALPPFARYWSSVEQESPPAGPARAQVPLRLRAPDGSVLQFRLSAEPFTRDARFRLVYYFPDDESTMRRYRPGRRGARVGAIPGSRLRT